MQEEYCSTHGDLYVAFDKKKETLVCNQVSNSFIFWLTENSILLLS
jgi:hypothetical protein